jgi:hypothetical protein
LEISSLQFINILLYKELNNNNNIVRNTLNEETGPTQKYQISTVRDNRGNARRYENHQSTLPVATANRFSALTNLLDTTPRNETPPFEETSIIGRSHQNYKRKQYQKQQYGRYNGNSHTEECLHNT